MVNDCEWTSEPPRKPGWYWWRKGMEPRPMKVWWQAGDLVASTRPMAMKANLMGGEWWPRKIREPSSADDETPDKTDT